MFDLIVLGEIPGTDLQLSFGETLRLEAVLVLALVLVWRHRHDLLKLGRSRRFGHLVVMPLPAIHSVRKAVVLQANSVVRRLNRPSH